MKLIRLAFLFCAICAFSGQIKSQYFENPQKKPSFKDKLFFGGGLGLQFGDVTQIEVAPIVGYKVSERFQPGIGLTYSFFKDNTFSPPIKFSTYGGSVFFRFFLFDGLFAEAEAEGLNVEAFNFTSPTSYYTERVWIGNYLVGGGYFQKIGERGGMYFLVLWNLNQTELTPYANPVMKLGFSF